jgi:hypothetical protein
VAYVREDASPNEVSAFNLCQHTGEIDLADHRAEVPAGPAQTADWE